MLPCGTPDLTRRRKIVKMMIERFKASASHADHDGRSPIHSASQEKEVEVVKYLVLECGCDCMQRDFKHSVTPLHLSASPLIPRCERGGTPD